MYSSSNSFLAGVNDARPGQPQASFAQFPQSGQQQPPNLAPQPTAFPGRQLHPQPTSFVGAAPQQGFTSFVPQQQQQLQPQFTNYPSQSQQSPQSLRPPAQQQFPETNAAGPLIPQKTSSQIAQSFHNLDVSSRPKPPPKGVFKVPNIRLSFITAQDQAKFEQLFKTAVGDNQTLDGEKAKDLLLRSKLPGSDLSKIWVLSDTTKSGQLFFPEFALAMYLCNLRLMHKDLPVALPERIKNEVSSMVDIISFGVPDTQSEPKTNVPNFDIPLMQNAAAPPAPQQPQPQQPSNSQLLSQLTTQPTGFYHQATGFQLQQTGFPTQNQNLLVQPTGFPLQQPPSSSLLSNPQPTGYSGPRPPMPPMPTGFGSNLLSAQAASSPITAQPTGIPGQWGFVNTPSTGLPNIEALKQQLMPQPGREGGFTTAGLSGNATIPWAVTKDEKKIYDQLFRAWDGFNKGYIGGDTAIEIMGQSGLPDEDLERIWTLSDPHNRGRLNLDEFAVAMHLIYRKLNGHPIPNRLPPELIPPSTKNFNDSIGTMKSFLSQDAENRKAPGGISYLKDRSFHGGTTSSGLGRKDATLFKNNDDFVGYRSSARRRIGNEGRTPSPAPSSQASEQSEEEMTLEELKKKIYETRVLLEAVDLRDQNETEGDDALDRRDRKEAESLMDRIRKVQDDIDAHPRAVFRHVDSSAERRSLRRQLQAHQDQLPEVASDARKAERAIADARLELFRLKDARLHPNNSLNIMGTGPGGEVTEPDRIKARARARMQARAAELAGRPVPQSDDEGAATSRLEEENSKVKAERERNEAMTQDVEESVKEFSRSLEDSLKDSANDSTREHERGRWEDALGVEDVIRDFIYDLQRSSRTARVRKEEQTQPSRIRDPPPPEPRIISTNETISQPASSTGLTTPFSKLTHEERVASARERAQKRIAERMAAAGLKPQADIGESLPQRQEREKKEREERLRRAEEEDAKREQERQRRLADERAPAPPTAKISGKKPPPAPPSRKGRTDSTGQADTKKVEEAAKAAQAQAEKAKKEASERALRDKQEAQAAESRRLEEEARRQEQELEREKEAQEARLRALEEEVRQGKLKKLEEKRRKQAAEREAKEKEARLAAQRAELEAAKERERELQRQLQGLADESSSDDEDPVNITPQDSTPTQSQVLPSVTVGSSPPPAPPDPENELKSAVDSPASSRGVPTSESRNPYFKQLNQSTESQPSPSTSALQPTILSPSKDVQSTNPFHRFAQQQESVRLNTSAAVLGPLERKSRARPEDDDWSVAGSEKGSSDDDDDDDDQPYGGSAKQLASILFGTMGPPRPLSAVDDDKSPSKSATPVQGSPVAPLPPPPPPLPVAVPDITGTSGAPLVPPPPPPPPPPALSGQNLGQSLVAPLAPPPPPPSAMEAPGVPPPPPPSTATALVATAGGIPDRSALFASIQAGKGLKKVETKDRSASTLAGRVLD